MSSKTVCSKQILQTARLPQAAPRGATGRRSTRRCSRSTRPRRRGAMIVLIAVLMVVMIATVALSVDVAYMQLVRTQLRGSADAASRASTEAFSRTQSLDVARQAAKDVAAANFVAGKPLILDDADIVFGRATMQATGAWLFSAGDTPTNSVQIISRRTATSPSGAVPLFFARVFGNNTFEPTQQATSLRLDWDVCLVVERSTAVKFDIDGSGAYQNAGGKCHPPNMLHSRWGTLAVCVADLLAGLDATAHKEHISVVSFATPIVDCNCSNTRVELNQSLTDDTLLVQAAIDEISSRKFTGDVDIAAGIDAAVDELINAPGARAFAAKMIVVFSGGNNTEGRGPFAAAQDAAGQNITIHTVTFGHDADQASMQAVADIAGGKHLHTQNPHEIPVGLRELTVATPVIFAE